MKCPLDQIDMIEKQGDGFDYHECEACNGLWMRHRALRGLVHQYSPNSDISIPLPDDAYLPFSDSKFDTNNITRCPVDGAPYYEHSYGDVMIDLCPQCDGLWFDRGELDKIKEKLKNDEIPSGVLSTVIHDLSVFFLRKFTK